MKCRYSILLASAASAAFLVGPSPASAQVDLRTAANFAVLGGPAVTCTRSTIEGNVGVANGPITRTLCTISGTVHEADPAAQQAYADFQLAYDAVANDVSCDVNLTGQSLAGMSLTPGVYCFDGFVAEAGGTLTLDGPADGIWIFKIGSAEAGGYLELTDFSVVMPGGTTCNNNVLWWTGEYVALTGSDIKGGILSGLYLTATNSVVDGQALASAAVTLTDSTVSYCAGPLFPPNCKVKVTGGGQIQVPDPASTGRANFGFNARQDRSGDGANGHFNYRNHVTGLHIEGPVTGLEVIATNPDGSPKTLRLSGTCHGTPACSFSVTVEDNGEPGRMDQFGITVTGGLSEVTSQRVISRGNIQFHKSGCGDEDDDHHGGRDDSCDDRGGDGHHDKDKDKDKGRGKKS